MKRMLSAWIVAIALIIPIQVFAQGGIDVNQDSTLKLYCIYENAAIENMSFDIYRIGRVNAEGEYSIEEDYAAYDSFIDFSDMGKEKDDALAETVKVYAERDGISPDDRRNTDKRGEVIFQGLRPGMFLVVGHSAVKEGKEYIVKPFLIAVPGRNSETGLWDYVVNGYPKLEVKTDSCDLSVIKNWENYTEENQPEKVTVQLLKNGEEFDTVELSNGNNWKHIWKNLDRTVEWSIAEKTVPEQSKVTVTSRRNVFIVTNTNKEFSSTGEKGDSQGTDNLPQTGQLWWPVPALLFTGLVFIFIGLLRRERGEAPLSGKE